MVVVVQLIGLMAAMDYQRRKVAAQTHFVLSQAGLQTAVLESVTRERAGSASGIYSTCRYAGSIAGSSALPMLYGVGDEIAGFTRVLTVVVITAFAATLATLGIQHRPSPH